jgi:hypothetical protein
MKRLLVSGATLVLTVGAIGVWIAAAAAVR